MTDEELTALARRMSQILRETGPAFVAVQDAVVTLNRLFAADPDAMHSLATHRVPCSELLADDPTCQVVRTDPAKPARVGLIGVINALFGTTEGGGGRICAVFNEETGRLEGFDLTSAAKREPIS